MESVINIAIEYQDIFLAGIKITIIISLLACLFGLLLGIILAFMKLSKYKILRWIAGAYVEIVRGTPTVSYTHLRAHETS